MERSAVFVTNHKGILNGANWFNRKYPHALQDKLGILKIKGDDQLQKKRRKKQVKRRKKPKLIILIIKRKKSTPIS